MIPPLSLTCNSKVPCVFQFMLPLLPLLPLPLQTIEMNLSKAKSNGGRPATTSDGQFPVSQYMVDDVELPWGHLAAHVEIKHAQIRLRNVLQGEALILHFIVNHSPRHFVDLSPGRRCMGPCV